jgi:hypothetical protein
MTFSGQIDMQVMANQSLSLGVNNAFITLLGSGNQIIGTSTLIVNPNIGSLSIDENQNFTGYIDFVSVISQICNPINYSSNQISDSIQNQLTQDIQANETSYISTYIADIIPSPTYGIDGKFSLYNDKTTKYLNDYANLSFVSGPASGGLVGYKNEILGYNNAKTDDAFNVGKIIYDKDKNEFSGQIDIYLMFPFITVFRSFIFDPNWKPAVYNLVFKGQGNSITAYSGQMNGSISLE